MTKKTDILEQYVNSLGAGWCIRYVMIAIVSAFTAWVGGDDGLAAAGLVGVVVFHFVLHPRVAERVVDVNAVLDAAGLEYAASDLDGDPFVEGEFHVLASSWSSSHRA